MLDYGLFTLWRKIQFYRAIILLCLCLSALTITAGIITGYLLYDGAFQLSYKIAAITDFTQMTSTQWAGIAESAQREQKLVGGLIAIAFATFLFGFVVPALVIQKLIGTLKNLESQLRQTLQDLARDFSATLDQYGDSAFANAQYWAEVAMIALEFAGRDSRNPSLMLMADLSGLTRAEMSKVRLAQARDKKPA